MWGNSRGLLIFFSERGKKEENKIKKIKRKIKDEKKNETEN